MRQPFTGRVSWVAVAVAVAAAAACATEASRGGGEDGGPTTSIDSVCAEEREYFASEIFRPILAVSCIGCHNSEGSAGGSRMVLVPESEPGSLEHNLRQILRVAAEAAGGKSLLLAMPSDTNPERSHPGGLLLQENSVAYDKLETFISHVQTPECDVGSRGPDCTDGVLLPRRLWRLTPGQYDNTVRTLTGITGTWGHEFPADTVVDGFDNNAHELLVSPLLADKFMVAAEDIAGRIDVSALAPCATGRAEQECARDFITTFGERAFRRPVTTGDIARYEALFATTPRFEEGIRLVVTAMLQSPHFLYRRELGEANADSTYVLSGYEVASELSYLVWNDMPDDELLEKARSGLLNTAERIATEAERLFASPRARPALRRFLFQWLGIQALRTLPKDAQSFPELTEEVRESLVAEAEHVLDDIVFDGSSSLSDLLTSPVTFLDPVLSAFYGHEIGDAAANERGFGRVPLPATERQGVLTLGSVMLAHGRSNDSSPVNRGRFVRERLLCQPPPPPPPGINAEPPPFDPSLTSRERYAAHSESEPCHSCHRLMDPIGFSFERFDGIGRYRETENGLPIDVSGEILNSPSSDARFEGTGELAALLAKSDDVAKCFVLQWFRYGSGFKDDRTTACAVQDLESEFKTSAHSVRGLLLALSRSEFFGRRGGASRPAEPIPEEPPGSPEDAGPLPPSTPPDAPPPPPPPPDNVALERIVDNDYGSGYCHTYRVTNTGASSLQWSVTLPIEGSLTQNWESEAVLSGNNVTFTGVAHNQTLEAGTSAEFGFCVER